MFEPIEIKSRKQVVLEELKNAIFKGQLSPGDSLKELLLAKQFNVSQAVIREALIELEQVGLASKIPNKGTMIKKISEQEIRDRMAVRTHLEKLACSRAVRRMDKQDFDELKRHIEQMKEALSNDQYLVLTRTDLEFHQYIWKKTNNEILYDALTRIVTPLFYISLNMQQIHHWTRISNFVELHENYVKALLSRNKEKIKKAIHGHVKDTYEMYHIDEIENDL